MPNTIDYIVNFGSQSWSGLDRTAHLDAGIFCYVSDGAGNPAADGTDVYWTQWVTGLWSNSPSPCTPTTTSSHGSTVQVKTYKGFAPIDLTHFSSGLGARAGGWFVSLTNTPGTGPNFAFDTLCVGGSTLSAAFFGTPPVLTGIPGDGQILWKWTVPPILDSHGIPVVYGISVTTGTPSSNPAASTNTDNWFLSTGLTNGTTYKARVQAWLRIGTASNGTTALYFNSARAAAAGDGTSLIASAVPRAQKTYLGTLATA